MMATMRAMTAAQICALLKMDLRAQVVMRTTLTYDLNNVVMVLS